MASPERMIVGQRSPPCVTSSFTMDAHTAASPPARRVVSRVAGVLRERAPLRHDGKWVYVEGFAIPQRVISLSSARGWRRESPVVRGGDVGADGFRMALHRLGRDFDTGQQSKLLPPLSKLVSAPPAPSCAALQDVAPKLQALVMSPQLESDVARGRAIRRVMARPISVAMPSASEQFHCSTRGRWVRSSYRAG